MASLAEATIRIRADTSTFTRDINGRLRDDRGRYVAAGKDAGGHAGRGFGSGMSGAIGGIAKKVFAPLIAAAAGAGLVNMFSGFVAEARDAEKIGRLTAQVIKTTGGAAKITAGQVSDLAGAISAKTGIDDDAIQSASNLLLTFSNVRNEAGKGNDVFNQATQAAIDMSVVLGTDARGASIQLGKALNDPVKGITALSKAGVSFTEQQKTQIKTLVASGDTLGAQKIILAELGKEFGGAAAAAATPMDRLRVTVGNLKEGIGTALLPTVDRFATFMLNKGIPALTSFGGKAKAAFTDLMAGIRGTGDGKGRLEALGTIITEKVVPAVQSFGRWFRDDALPALKDFGGYLRGTVFPVIQQIARDVLPGAVAAFHNVRDAIAENRPQLQQLWERFKQVADFVVTRVLPVLGPIVSHHFKTMGMTISGAIKTIGFLVDAFNLMRTVVATVLTAVTSVFFTFVDNMLNGAIRAFGWIGPLKSKLETAKAEFGRFKDGVNRAIAGITPGKAITVTAFGRVSLGGGRYTNVPINAASGGYISGPGGPRSDSIPARLSDGEFVVNAYATRRARPMLEALNARRYAAGGLVTRTSHGLGSWPDKYEGVVTAMMSKTAQKLLDASTALLGAGRNGAYGGVLSHVAASGDAVNRLFGPLSIGGRAGRPGNYSDHPRGLALDFMTGSNTGLGHRIAGFLTSSWFAHKIKYLIWNAMYAGSPGRWTPYSHPLGRTDATSMHRDHVHASYDSYEHGGVIPGRGPRPIMAHGGETVIPRGGGTVRLHPEDRELLAAVANRPIRLHSDLTLNGQRVAEDTSQRQAQARRRFARATAP